MPQAEELWVRARLLDSGEHDFTSTWACGHCHHELTVHNGAMNTSCKHCGAWNASPYGAKGLVMA